MRDPLKIDLQSLALAINSIAPHSTAHVTGESLVLDDVIIKLNNGIIIIGKTKTRYRSLKELIDILHREHILVCKMEQVFEIAHEYNRLCLKH